MAHFYGSVQGAAGEATRLGHKNSGLQTRAQTWGMALGADLYHDPDKDTDAVSVTFRSLKQSRHAHAFTLEDPDLVASVLDDVKVNHLFHRMNELGRKISEEAPKAAKRKAREQARKQREKEQQEKKQMRVFDTLNDDELATLAEFCSFASVGRLKEQAWQVRDKLFWNSDGDVCYRVPAYNFDAPRVYNISADRYDV